MCLTWRQIRTEGDWNELVRSADQFHDAVVKDIVFSSGQYVRPDRTIVYPRGNVVWILIQSQLNDVQPLELRFRDVGRLCYDPDLDFEPHMIVEEKRLTLFQNGLRWQQDAVPLLCARAGEYRFSSDDRLGAGPFEVPIVDGYGDLLP